MITNLTKRELEVGLCLIDGMSVKEASRTLGISVYTVVKYKENIKRKINAKNSFHFGRILGRIIEEQYIFKLVNTNF